MALIIRLPWDSEFFGHEIGQCTFQVFTLPSGEVEFCREFQDSGLDCVYVFMPHTVEAATLARRYGWFLVEVRNTYALAECWLWAPDSRSRGSVIIDPSDEKAIGEVKEIARELSGVSRFSFDSRFRPRAPALYERWVEKILKNPQGKILAVRDDGRVASFIGLELKDGIGELVLVATHSAFRGRGLGWRVMYDAIRWLHLHGAERIMVRTQQRNIAAIQHYERVGFRIAETSLVYHAWKGW